MSDNPQQAPNTPAQPPAQPPASPAAALPVTASSEQVTQLMIDQAKKFNPLASPWWMGLIQGILAAGLGLIVWLEPSGVTGTILQFVALFLVIVGLMDMMGGMSIAKRSTVQSLEFWRGVIGFVGGLVILSLLFLGFFASAGAVGFGKSLMGIVTLAYGVLGIFVAFMRDEKRGRWTLVIVSVIFALLGVSLLFDKVAGFTAKWAGPVLIILGVGLIIYAFMRRSREKQAREQAA